VEGGTPEGRSTCKSAGDRGLERTSRCRDSSGKLPFAFWSWMSAITPERSGPEDEEDEDGGEESTSILLLLEGSGERERERLLLLPLSDSPPVYLEAEWSLSAASRKMCWAVILIGAGDFFFFVDSLPPLPKPDPLSPLSLSLSFSLPLSLSRSLSLLLSALGAEPYEGEEREPVIALSSSSKETARPILGLPRAR